MPTYEYKCESCGYTFEEFQNITDDSLTECPKCGGELIRVIHGGLGVIFKGSGWYVTDYGKGRSAATVGTCDTSTKPESKPEKETSGKPAKKGKSELAKSEKKED